jgi:hypothetical protein
VGAEQADWTKILRTQRKRQLSFQLTTRRYRKLMFWIQAATILTAILRGSSATAQQAPAPAQQPAAAPPITWESMPRMQIEGQFAGPLKDTAIQRLRDPQTNVVCYVYLPFTAAHSPPTATSYVQYGPNSIGSISCVEPAKPQPAAAAARPPSPAPKRSPAPASSEPARP